MVFFTRFSLGLLCGVAACSPLRLYHQPGIPVARMQQDLLACEVDALQSAPVATQVRQGPPRYVPTTRYCDANGTCYRHGGYYIDGEIYSVDVNADLRRRVERQCMGAQGYRFVEVPNCTSGVARQVPVAATDILPPLSARSCAIRNSDGTWQIVDVAP